MHLIALKKTFPPEPCQDYEPWFKIQCSRSIIHDLLVSSLQDHPEFKHGIFPVISTQWQDSWWWNRSNYQISKLPKKKKHMVTVLWIHHQLQPVCQTGGLLHGHWRFPRALSHSAWEAATRPGLARWLGNNPISHTHLAMNPMTNLVGNQILNSFFGTISNLFWPKLR